MKRIWIAVFMAGSFLLGAAGTYVVTGFFEKEESRLQEAQQTGDTESGKKADFTDLEKVERAFQLIMTSYVEKVEEEILIEGAIQGMLAVLDDPYSVYMDKEMSSQFNESLDSTFEGIGAEVSMIDGKVIIVAPFKNSPAEKAGIKPNDQILSIDGESVEGLNLYEATKRIRGKKGTIVTLEISRDGLSQPQKIEIKRDEIPQITVHHDIKKHAGKNIGYLQITSFSEGTAREFKDALAKMEKKRIAGLIIDVRGNPGGLLPSVEEIIKQLVTKEKPYVQIEKRDGEKIRFYSDLKKGKKYPIVVLIDKGSASASEILAGALREVEGYTLIGETTFGKGTVQQAVPMGDGSDLKLTVFKWLTPDGNWIHKKGIKPDIPVEQPAVFKTNLIQIEKTLEREMNNDKVKNAQIILDALGYEPGRQDGYFSADTETALIAFQNQHGLEPTGKIDKKTASALEKAAREEIQKEEKDLQLQAALRYLTR